MLERNNGERERVRERESQDKLSKIKREKLINERTI